MSFNQKTVIPSRFANWRGNPPLKKEIATPACAPVRNDKILMTFLSVPGIFYEKRSITAKAPFCSASALTPQPIKRVSSVSQPWGTAQAPASVPGAMRPPMALKSATF